MPGDMLLLTGDGVLAALPATGPARELEALAGSIPVFALADDCAVRGVGTLANAIELTDYAGFVALACEQPRSVSWF